MLARIYRPAKTSMQSGTAKTKDWVLDFEPEQARAPNALTGWTGSGDMRGQVRLTFETRDDAIAYAQANNIPHQVTERREPKRVIKAYADNFSAARKEPWSH
jgi:hypothetical protein